MSSHPISQRGHNQASSSSSSQPEPLNFDTIIRTTYADAGQDLLPGHKGKTHGPVLYTAWYAQNGDSQQYTSQLDFTSAN
jgi:hypothetical protein